MNDIVICEFMDQAPIDAIRGKYKILYEPTLVDKRQELFTALRHARAIVVRNRTQVNEELLNHAPSLEVVGRLGVGLDNIDLSACKKRKIKVCPATGANDDAVAEWVICTVLQLLRNAYSGQSQMLAGAWPRNQMIGREMDGKTLGLIGYGGIARATATRARALGMSVLAIDPFLPPDDSAWQSIERIEVLQTLLERSDAVSLHVPLTEQTRNLIGKAEFATMKKHAVLVNAARGGVVNEAELAAALTKGILSGAALDVFESEPLTAEAAMHFSGLSNLILTPHIAGVTDESNVRVSKLTIDNIIHVMEAKL